MKKVLLLLLMVAAFVACSKDDEKEIDNKLVGTTWAWENYMFGLINGGTWYQIIQFTSNETYTSFYKKEDGTIKNKEEGCKYEYQDTKVTLYKSDGEEWNTFIFDGNNKMYPETNEDVVFEKQ